MKQSVLTTLDISDCSDETLQFLEDLIDDGTYLPRYNRHEHGYTIFLGGNGEGDLGYLESFLIGCYKLENEGVTVDHTFKQLIIQAIMDGHAFINIDNG